MSSFFETFFAQLSHFYRFDYIFQNQYDFFVYNAHALPCFSTCKFCIFCVYYTLISQNQHISSSLSYRPTTKASSPFKNCEDAANIANMK